MYRSILLLKLPRENTKRGWNIIIIKEDILTLHTFESQAMIDRCKGIFSELTLYDKLLLKDNFNVETNEANMQK